VCFCVHSPSSCCHRRTPTSTVILIFDDYYYRYPVVAVTATVVILGVVVLAADGRRFVERPRQRQCITIWASGWTGCKSVSKTAPGDVMNIIIVIIRITK
jgi:hypothetical protein